MVPEPYKQRACDIGTSCSIVRTFSFHSLNSLLEQEELELRERATLAPSESLIVIIVHKMPLTEFM
jgi:hypothetical protein